MFIERPQYAAQWKLMLDALNHVITLEDDISQRYVRVVGAKNNLPSISYRRSAGSRGEQNYTIREDVLLSVAMGGTGLSETIQTICGVTASTAAVYIAEARQILKKNGITSGEQARVFIERLPKRTKRPSRKTSG